MNEVTILLRGEPYVLPQDLYIPPEALEIILDMFTGPLDLLLYLIKRQNLDILDIPIVAITRQYITYIDMMRDLRIELAAEYLVMAATLAEIKSRMLLPRPVTIEEEASDPRVELVRRLQEYEQFKQAAEQLHSLPKQNEDTFAAHVFYDPVAVEMPQPEVELSELLRALHTVLIRAKHHVHHQIKPERLSVQQRMNDVLTRLQQQTFTPFEQLFSAKEGKLGIVVTFIAILELLKQALVEVVQSAAYNQIHIKPITQVAHGNHPT